MKTWVLILILSKGAVSIPGYPSKKACEASAKAIPEVRLYSQMDSEGKWSDVKAPIYENFYCIEGPTIESHEIGFPYYSPTEGTK